MGLVRLILEWVRTLTTGRDNQTPDVIRIGSILLGTQFLALAAYSAVVLKQPFDAMAYGGGAAAILGATGAALGMKRKDEPDG